MNFLKSPIFGSLVFKPDPYYIFVSLLRVINHIEILCAKYENGLVLGVDTTYNLCNIWVTDTSYRNQKISKNKYQKASSVFGPFNFSILLKMSQYSHDLNWRSSFIE